MPTIITQGTASARGFGFGSIANRTPAVFRSGVGMGASSSFVNFGTGTVAGDFVVIFALNGAGAVSGGSGGWSSYNGTWYHSAFYVFWKNVTATDVTAAAAGTLDVGSPYEAIALTYINPTDGSVRSAIATGPTGGTSLTIPGFNRSVGCRGVMALCTERDNVTPGTPSGFTSRVTDTGTFSFKTNATDLLGTAYANGAGITFTGLTATNGEQAFAFEMT